MKGESEGEQGTVKGEKSEGGAGDSEGGKE